MMSGEIGDRLIVKAVCMCFDINCINKEKKLIVRQLIWVQWVRNLEQKS